MQAKLVTDTGSTIESCWAHSERDIKLKLGKLAKYTARQGLTCRIEVYQDDGEMLGYYGPLLGLQSQDNYRADWWAGKVKAERSAVGRTKGEPKPPKPPRVRLHPVDSHPYPSIYLTDAQAAKARALGDGNLSVGIRAAIDAAI